jgi:CubicO group peptidase (beta-lactamase class C family)
VGTLMRGGAPLLRPESLHWVEQNQLPARMWIGFPGVPREEGHGHSFAASVSEFASPGNPATVPGELQWGGLAGTKWFHSPREQLAAVLMTQRYMGYGLPYWTQFKELVRGAMA